jgi:hypothetical protein
MFPEEMGTQKDPQVNRMANPISERLNMLWYLIPVEEDDYTRLYLMNTVK